MTKLWHKFYVFFFLRKLGKSKIYILDAASTFAMVCSICD